ERKSITRRVQMRLAAVPGQEPGDVGTAAVGWRDEHRHAEALDQALRVAFVPRGGEHDHRLALGRELEDLVRHGQRVEEKQTGAVVERVRRDLWAPRRARRPL